MAGAGWGCHGAHTWVGLRVGDVVAAGDEHKPDAATHAAEVAFQARHQLPHERPGLQQAREHAQRHVLRPAHPSVRRGLQPPLRGPHVGAGAGLRAGSGCGTVLHVAQLFGVRQRPRRHEDGAGVSLRQHDGLAPLRRLHGVVVVATGGAGGVTVVVHHRGLRVDAGHRGGAFVDLVVLVDRQARTAQQVAAALVERQAAGRQWRGAVTSLVAPGIAARARQGRHAVFAVCLLAAR